MRAVGPPWLGPTAIDEIEIPAAPRCWPTTPIIPGRSSLRTTSMWADGGTSTEWSSTLTTLGSTRVPIPAKVPETL